MGASLLSYTFNGGEISPLVSARFEQQKYQSGCLRLKNMICLAQGPATRRPGTKYLGLVKETDNDNTVRIFPFVFSTVEARVLEFGAGYIRIWMDDALVESDGSTYEVETSFTSDDVKSLCLAQSADVVYIASSNHHPCKLSRYADDDWCLEDINFIPTTTAPTGLSATKTSTESTNTYKYVVTTVDNETGEESLPSSAVTVKSAALNNTDGVTITLTWTAVTGALQYRVYKQSGGVYGYIGTATAPEVTLTDNNIGADTEDTPPSAEDPFTGAGYYPSIVFMWQQRLGWASSDQKPFTIWFSPSANLESLAASTPPADDDAITATLATKQANRIQWVEADRALAVGTNGNEWIFGPTDGTAVTPSSTFLPQGNRGSEFLPALQTGSALLFVQRGGDTIREFSYSYVNDKYDSPDMGIISSHLLYKKMIVSWTYQLSPHSVIWAALDDGTMVGVTYIREHQVVGWHQHATDGAIEDICCIPGANGYDEVWMIVRRTVGDEEVRYVERFMETFLKSTDPADAWFVDSGVHYSGEETATLTAVAPHLSGRTVKIWADGVEQPEKVVGSDGTVTLDYAASEVTLGLSFDSEIIPTRPELTAADGTTMTRKYKVNRASVKLFRSMGVWAGKNEDEIEEILVHDASDPIPPAFFTGNKEAVVDTGWNDEWGFIVKAVGPVPMTVLAVVYTTEIGDK